MLYFIIGASGPVPCSSVGMGYLSTPHVVHLRSTHAHGAKRKLGTAGQVMHCSASLGFSCQCLSSTAAAGSACRRVLFLRSRHALSVRCSVFTAMQTRQPHICLWHSFMGRHWGGSSARSEFSPIMILSVSG